MVVPTRNRPQHALECVGSILANPGDAFELVVVDQSGDDQTERLLETRASDRRLRYVRSATRGASASRNVGIARTRGPIVAFTDDDCRVSPDWILRLARVFADEPDAGIVFGRVCLPPGAIGGFAAQFQPHRREYQNAFPGPGVEWGIGANMAVRRRVLERVGVFDELLGPGSPFPAAEDTDLAIRVIAAGIKIVNATEVSVLHLGIREGVEASQLIRGYGVALGAAFTKQLRLRTRGGAMLLSQWLVFHTGRSVGNALRGIRPSGFGFVVGLLRGMTRSVMHDIDRSKQVYAGSRPAALSND